MDYKNKNAPPHFPLIASATLNRDSSRARRKLTRVFYARPCRRGGIHRHSRHSIKRRGDKIADRVRAIGRPIRKYSIRRALSRFSQLPCALRRPLLSKSSPHRERRIAPVPPPSHTHRSPTPFQASAPPPPLPPPPLPGRL